MGLNQFVTLYHTVCIPKDMMLPTSQSDEGSHQFGCTVTLTCSENVPGVRTYRAASPAIIVIMSEEIAGGGGGGGTCHWTIVG